MHSDSLLDLKKSDLCRNDKINLENSSQKISKKLPRKATKCQILLKEVMEENYDSFENC